MAKQPSQSKAPKRHQLVAAAVCAVLIGSAFATGWSIHEALEERRVATAATSLRLAAQTVASADALHAAGIAPSQPDLASSVEVLGGDHGKALRSLTPSEREEADVLLTEIAGCGILLLESDGAHQEPHGHQDLQDLLAVASVRAEDGAATAERRALVALVIAGIAAATAVLFLIRSRTSENRLRRDLQRQANTDLLTGLPNRRALGPVLQAAKLKMEDTDCATSLIFLDLDGFKDINDTLGHHAGDALLVQVAERLKGAQRANDVLLRLGGDEFAVVLSGLAEVEAAERVAYRYLHVLKEPFDIDSRPELLRSSIGVATTTDRTNMDALSAEADMAMYEAKRSGGNSVAVFDRSMEIESNEISRITRALRAANYDDEFSVVYQPIVTADGETTTGYEALLRWTSPSLGNVGPNDFIPVAERSGEILDIGWWVLEQVCRQLHTWDQTDQHIGRTVSCNVSPHQLAQSDFVEHVLAVIDRWQIPRDRLVLEVTESAVLDSRGAALNCLSQLRKAGLSVSIDDFGSGYSNLGQLLQVPFDIIKIDRSLLLTVTGMGQRSDNDPNGPWAIMEAIVAIASFFDAPVVCEGVETEEQRRSLEASGITHVQGYLTGRPTPPATLSHTPDTSLASTK